VIEAVEVPEWGGVVHVRSITAAERGQIEAAAASFKENKGKGDFAKMFTQRFAVLSLCDEKGNRLFKDEDITALAQKNAAVISRIAEVAQRLSGFGKKDIEELEKNSGQAQPEGSLSD
jgi:hypothetical protein